VDNKIKIIRALSFFLVIIWMISVFNFSAEKGEKSSNTSKGVTKEVVDIITVNNKEISKEEKENLIDKIEPIIRKCAHYTLYLIGGLLIINAVNTYSISDKKKMVCSLMFGIIYASTDELHQYFIPDRSARVTDVLIDSIGVLTGILIFCMLKKLVIFLKKKIINQRIVEGK
jgi:VanZ family protein